jgi:hypothetical protein
VPLRLVGSEMCIRDRLVAIEYRDLLDRELICGAGHLFNLHGFGHDVGG